MIEDSLYEVTLVWHTERKFYVDASTPGKAIDMAVDEWGRELEEQAGIYDVKTPVFSHSSAKRLCAFSSILQ